MRTHNERGEELVTKKDLQDWNPFICYRESKEPERKRIPYNQRKWASAKVERVRRKSSPSRNATNEVRAKTNEQAAAMVIKFLNALGYDLGARTTPEERQKWREGWNLFCVAIQVAHPTYTPYGMAAAIKAIQSNSPSRVLLDQMFQKCKENSKFSHKQVKQMLGI